MIDKDKDVIERITNLLKYQYSSYINTLEDKEIEPFINSVIEGVEESIRRYSYYKENPFNSVDKN